MVTVMGLGDSRDQTGIVWGLVIATSVIITSSIFSTTILSKPTTLLQRSLLQQNHASMSGWKERLHYLV